MTFTTPYLTSHSYIALCEGAFMPMGFRAGLDVPIQLHKKIDKMNYACFYLVLFCFVFVFCWRLWRNQNTLVLQNHLEL